MKAHEIIAKPEAWGQGDMKLNIIRFGNRVTTCFCAVGAIREKYGYNGDVLFKTIEADQEYCGDLRKLAAVVAHPHEAMWLNQAEIEDWNDHRTRTHAEVLDAMRRADV